MASTEDTGYFNREVVAETCFDLNHGAMSFASRNCGMPGVYMPSFLARCPALFAFARCPRCTRHKVSRDARLFKCAGCPALLETPVCPRCSGQSSCAMSTMFRSPRCPICTEASFLRDVPASKRAGCSGCNTLCLMLCCRQFMKPVWPRYVYIGSRHTITGFEMSLNRPYSDPG